MSESKSFLHLFWLAAEGFFCFPLWINRVFQHRTVISIPVQFFTHIFRDVSSLLCQYWIFFFVHLFLFFFLHVFFFSFCLSYSCSLFLFLVFFFFYFIQFLFSWFLFFLSFLFLTFPFPSFLLFRLILPSVLFACHNIFNWHFFSSVLHNFEYPRNFNKKKVSLQSPPEKIKIVHTFLPSRNAPTHAVKYPANISTEVKELNSLLRWCW